MNRFGIVRLNDHFVVTDNRSSRLWALTSAGTPANITNPDEVKFFQLSQAEAEALAATLSAR